MHAKCNGVGGNIVGKVKLNVKIGIFMKAAKWDAVSLSYAFFSINMKPINFSIKSGTQIFPRHFKLPGSQVIHGIDYSVN